MATNRVYHGVPVAAQLVCDVADRSVTATDLAGHPPRCPVGQACTRARSSGRSLSRTRPGTGVGRTTRVACATPTWPDVRSTSWRSGDSEKLH